MSELTSEQKYHLAMRLIDIVGSMLAPPRGKTQESAVLPEKPQPRQEPQYLDPSVEEKLATLVSGFIRPIEEKELTDGI